VYKLPFLFLAVILAKAGIHCFQEVLDPRVKPEDDDCILCTQPLINYPLKIVMILFYKIPPNLPFPKGGIMPLFDKEGWGEIL